jgi:hypothetical protein
VDAYVSALQQVLMMSNTLSTSSSIRPEFPPRVTNQQWDGTYTT